MSCSPKSKALLWSRAVPRYIEGTLLGPCHGRHSSQAPRSDGLQDAPLEFIDMEHTPKNILIRAVSGSAGDRDKLWQEYTAFRDF